MLTIIIALPLLAALLLAFLPRDYRMVPRLVAVGVTLVDALVALLMFVRFDTGNPDYQFVQQMAWVESLGISYHVGVDGINVGLVLMGAVVAFAAACVCWDVQRREKEFFILLLVMTGGILGAFASLDLFFFYFFHELALVPTFIMIGVWGRGERKNYATFQITMYLTLGALISLVGLIAIYVQMGGDTFDITEMTARAQNYPIAAGAQNLIFPFLLFGFGILVSLWPFHSWAPLGYGSAPTATAMLHAGVLKKFGIYGLIRVALPLLPEGLESWIPVIAWLCLGNILYCGLVAMRQRDLNLLIGNSSVAHMGFVFLGIASVTLIGVTGAVLVMVAHGFLAALSFGLSGYLYQQKGDVNMDGMGGLLRQLPFIGSMVCLAMMAGCGVPGFANFAGELLVLFGAWGDLPWFVVAATWGALIIGAVYMLRAIRSILHGPAVESCGNLKDASPWMKMPFAVLLGAMLLFGVFPGLLTEKIKPSVQALLDAGASQPGTVVQVSNDEYGMTHVDGDDQLVEVKR